MKQVKYIVLLSGLFFNTNTFCAEYLELLPSDLGEARVIATSLPCYCAYGILCCCCITRCRLSGRAHRRASEDHTAATETWNNEREQWAQTSRQTITSINEWERQREENERIRERRRNWQKRSFWKRFFDGVTCASEPPLPIQLPPRPIPPSPPTMPVHPLPRSTSFEELLDPTAHVETAVGLASPSSPARQDVFKGAKNALSSPTEAAQATADAVRAAAPIVSSLYKIAAEEAKKKK